MSRPTPGIARGLTAVGGPSTIGVRPRKSSLTPKSRKTITTTQRRKSTGSSVPAMDRNSMMIVEANEISSYLQKEYEFTRKPSVTESSDEMLVKVLNKKLHVSCTWSLTKFKERLNKMRKLMYKNDNDTLSGDAVFFDPNDTWEREEGDSTSAIDTNANGPLLGSITSTPRPHTQVNLQSVVPDVIDVSSRANKSVAERPLSPQNQKSLQSSITEIYNTSSSSTIELPAESEFILKPRSPDILTNGALSGISREKEETRQISATRKVVNSVEKCNGDIKNQNAQDSESYGQSATPPSISSSESESGDRNVLDVCLKLAESLSASLNGIEMESEITMIDKILGNCESVKTSVINILGSYTSESNKERSCQRVTTSSIQLITSLELLVSNTTYFLSSFETNHSSVLMRLRNTIIDLVKAMTSQCATFLKGCKEHEDDLVHDFASDLIENLFEVVTLCGELSLATETLPMFLRELGDPESLDSEHTADVLRPKCSIEIRQSLLSGCDNYVGSSLKESLRSVRNCEASIESHLQETNNSKQSHEEILKHTEIIIATAKILILRFQEIQGEVTAHCKDETEEKPSKYFQAYFERCQLILSSVSNLSGSVGLLTHAGETTISEPEAGNLRKVSRCADMVSRATCRLLGVDSDSRSPISDLATGRASLSPPDQKPISLELHSVLSEAQIEDLNKAGRDVIQSAQTLVHIVKRSLTDQPDGGKVRRMLPATPAAGKGLARAQSARVRTSADRNRVSRRLSMIDSTKSQEF